MIVITLCLGCKKVNSTGSSSSLIGEWSWVSTCGGFAGTCYYPQQTKESVSLVYTMDSIYNYYQNDTLKYSTRFSTYKLLSKEGKDSVNFIKYDSGGSMNYSIFHDTLGISNYIFSSIYKRIK